MDPGLKLKGLVRHQVKINVIGRPLLPCNCCSLGTKWGAEQRPDLNSRANCLNSTPLDSRPIAFHADIYSSSLIYYHRFSLTRRVLLLYHTTDASLHQSVLQYHRKVSGYLQQNPALPTTFHNGGFTFPPLPRRALSTLYSSSSQPAIHSYSCHRTMRSHRGPKSHAFIRKRRPEPVDCTGRGNHHPQHEADRDRPLCRLVLQAAP